MASKRPFKINSIFTHKSLSLPTTTSDGQRVAFVASQPDVKQNKTISEIWCWSPDRKPWQVTYGGQANKPRFSPNDKSLAFLSDRGGKKAQLFIMNSDFCEGMALTDFEEGLFDFRFSPDSRKIAVIAVDDKTAEQKNRDADKLDWWTVDRDERPRQLYLVNADGSGKAKKVSLASEHINTVTFTADGKHLVYSSCPRACIDSQWSESELKIVGVSGRGRRTICPFIGRHVENRISVSTDNTRVLICESESRRYNFNNVVKVVDLKTGRKKIVAKNFDRQSMNTLWLDDNLVFFESDDLTDFRLYTCKPGQKPVQLPTPCGGASQAVYAAKSNELFYIYSSGEQPDELCRQTLDTNEDHAQLTNINRSAARLNLAKVEIINWKSPDGTEVEGLLYLPSNKGKRKPYPMIVMPHGGPYGSSINNYQTALVPSIYAAAGYACFLPNFRGSTSYGKEFTHKNVNDWGDGPWADINSGIDALIRRKIVDSKRLAIFGGSYGGYMTAWAIGHTNRFKCAVAVAAVINNLSMWATTDIPHYQLQACDYAKPSFTNEYWRDQSPIYYADKMKTPTLIITGDSDKRVPPTQSYELYQALRYRNVESELVLYPREPHGVSEPRHREHYFKMILDWINEHIS